MATPTQQKAVHPLLALIGIAGHGIALFVLPWLVGGITALFLDVGEVVQTADTLLIVSLVMVAPVFLAQIAGVVFKTQMEARLLVRRGELSARTLLDAAYRNTRIVTPRGYFLLAVGLFFVVMSLAFEWASLGVMAVASLVLFYLMTGISVFLSAFLVRRFSSQMTKKGASIERRFTPAVVQSGDPVDEEFVLRRVPILPGFYLVIHDTLPERLDTETRHVVPPSARSNEVVVSTGIRASPRGCHNTAPARIAYHDMLGVTRVNVASLATAELKCLPRRAAVEIIEPPRTPLEEPDLLTQRHRFPTEDYFRFREYHAGDDTRRLHWKLSMRVGQLQVRLPEAREINARKVVLALDTWVPDNWLPHTGVIDNLMDALVEVWIATARQLMSQGEHVTMVAALPGSDKHVRREAIPCGSNDQTRWLDAGARARWQSRIDVFDLFDEPGEDDEETFMVVLTSRLHPVPPNPLPSVQTTWIYLHPADTIGPPPPSLFALWLDHDDTGRHTGARQLLRFVQLPHPAGSEENTLGRRIRHFLAKRKRRARQLFIRRQVFVAGHQAFGALLSRPDVVYRMQVLADRYRLVGIQTGGAAGPRAVPPHGEVPPPPVWPGMTG